jgi:hypothetical protein
MQTASSSAGSYGTLGRLTSMLSRWCHGIVLRNALQDEKLEHETDSSRRAINADWDG